MSFLADEVQQFGDRQVVWGYAVRREWPDGTHDLFGFVARLEEAEERVARDRRYWRAGPVRPTAVYVVGASEGDVLRHPVDGCRSVWCLSSVERGR